MKIYIPLIVALITASVVVFGYVYEKDKEREFLIRQKQQEIYTGLINNFTKKHNYFRLLKQDPEFPRRVSTDNLFDVQNLIATKYPELQKTMDESVEIMALLSVYGTDEAINAAVNYYKQGQLTLQPGSTTNVDPGKFILDLRRSLFKDTKVKADEILLLLSD